MAVRLRPHHLLCVLTYVGKGYSPAFTAGFDVVAQRLAAGEPAVIVSGPDDICAPLLCDDDAHCHRASVRDRDRRAARDIGALLAYAIDEGTRVVLDAGLLARLRAAFAGSEPGRSAIRHACEGCEWRDLCSDIAAGGYRGARLVSE